MPQLLSIWIKRAKQGPMDAVAEAELRANYGIVGNANVRGRRQVTIIEKEAWDRHMTALGGTLDPSRRRANLMVGDFPLEGTRGRVMRAGGCRIRILGETKPCEQMEAALTGLRKVMYDHWGGGAFGEVLEGGILRVGDVVSWEEST